MLPRSLLYRSRRSALTFARRFKHKSSHDHLVVGIHVKQRLETVPKLQEVLSKYGGMINARLGLRHDSERHGLIILDIRDHSKERQHLIHELKALEDVDVQTMHFPWPE